MAADAKQSTPVRMLVHQYALVRVPGVSDPLTTIYVREAVCGLNYSTQKIEKGVGIVVL